MTERRSCLVHVTSGSRRLYTTTAPSCCTRALYCHLSISLQTMSITVVNLQHNRAVFRIFIALLRFSCDSPSYNYLFWFDESFLYSNIHSSFPVKPLSVRLLEKPVTLVAGTQYNITCEAVGSRPQAKISWLRGKDEFQRGHVSSEVAFTFNVIHICLMDVFVTVEGNLKD